MMLECCYRGTATPGSLERQDGADIAPAPAMCRAQLDGYLFYSRKRKVLLHAGNQLASRVLLYGERRSGRVF